MRRGISRVVSASIGALRKPTVPTVPASSLVGRQTRAWFTTEKASTYEEVAAKIDEGKVVLVSATYCPFCHQAKRLADQQEFSDTTVYEVDTLQAGADIRAGLTSRTEGHSTVPYVFVGGEFIGGATEMMNYWGMGVLQEKLDKVGVTYVDDE